jgi:hypothetical protein
MKTDEENVFRRAKEVLDEHGWNDLGAVENSEAFRLEDVGKVCVSVAVSVAEGNTNWRGWRSISLRRKTMMMNVIQDQWGMRMVPWSFNDWQGRTREDIDTLLDKCAALEDELV